MSEFRPEDRNVLIETHTLLKTYVKKSDDHEERLRVVERKQNKILATFFVISSAVGGTIASAWHKFFS